MYWLRKYDKYKYRGIEDLTLYHWIAYVFPINFSHLLLQTHSSRLSVRSRDESQVPWAPQQRPPPSPAQSSQKPLRRVVMGGGGRSMAAWSSVAPDAKPPKACGDSLPYLSPTAVALRYDREASHAKSTLI